jgi:hypothetical protein
MQDNAHNLFSDIPDDNQQELSILSFNSRNIEELEPHRQARDSIAFFHDVDIIESENLLFISTNLNDYKAEFLFRADQIIEEFKEGEYPSVFEVTERLLKARQAVRDVMCPRAEAQEYFDFPVSPEELDAEIQEYFVLSLMKIIDRKPMPRVFPSPRPEDIAARWKTRDKKTYKSPVEFIRVFYSEFLHKGLHRGHIRQIDPQLYAALANWLGKSDHDLPDDLGLTNSTNRYSDQSVTEEEISVYRKVDALRSAGKIKII